MSFPYWLIILVMEIRLRNWTLRQFVEFIFFKEQYLCTNTIIMFYLQYLITILLRTFRARATPEIGLRVDPILPDPILNLIPFVVQVPGIFKITLLIIC